MGFGVCENRGGFVEGNFLCVSYYFPIVSVSRHFTGICVMIDQNVEVFFRGGDFIISC